MGFSKAIGGAGRENLQAQLDSQEAIIADLEAKVQSVSAVDMITPVNEQTLTIQDIQEALVGKAAVNQVELTVTPGKDSQIYVPENGNTYSKVTVNGDSDLVPENIKEGIDIFGVIGSLKEGVKGIDSGVVTITSTTETITVEHNLGVVPKEYILYSDTMTGDKSVGTTLEFALGGTNIRYYDNNFNSEPVKPELTDTSITFKTYVQGNYNYRFFPATYRWIAIA